MSYVGYTEGEDEAVLASSLHLERCADREKRCDTQPLQTFDLGPSNYAIIFYSRSQPLTTEWNRFQRIRTGTCIQTCNTGSSL